jgi:hypothetical protein
MALALLAIISVAFIGVVIALGCMMISARPRDQRDSAEDLVAREQIFARASTRILGRHLADLAPAGKALVIVEQPTHPLTLKPLLDGLSEGLAEGLGKAATIAAIDAPDLSSTAGTMEDGNNAVGGIGTLEESLCAAHLDDLIAKHPDCRLVVSMIGMPADYSDMAIWTEDPAQRPIVAVALGDVPMLKNALLGQAIHAVVLPHANPTSEAPSSDPQDVFDQRYLLATPENVEELAAEHENLFNE